MTRWFSSGLVVIPNLFRDLGFGFRFFVLKSPPVDRVHPLERALVPFKFIFPKEEDVNCKISNASLIRGQLGRGGFSLPFLRATEVAPTPFK
jgi:hypothetical protein